MQNARGSDAAPFFGAIFLSLAVAWIALVIGGIPRPAEAQPVKTALTASWLKTDKDQDRVRPIRVATVSYRMDPPVQKVALRQESGIPWSCETVRAHASHLNERQRALMARILRLTKEQKAEAEKCLKEKRS